MSDDDLVTLIKATRRELAIVSDEKQALWGEAAARLHDDRGWTWSQIGREMGVNLTTAYRWARPYLRD